MVVEFYMLAEDVLLYALEDIHKVDSEELRQRATEICEDGEWGKAVDISTFASMQGATIQVLYINQNLRCNSTLLTFYPIKSDGTEDRRAPVLNNILILMNSCGGRGMGRQQQMQWLTSFVI